MALRSALILLLLGLASVRSWRFFHHGRVVGGNLGKPSHPEQHLPEGSKVQESWFTQNLDHFNPNDERTWKQRYYVNDEYASDSRKVAFLMIGGEGEATIEWMTKGSWIDYAKEYLAICFQLEHRYYGKSHPTEDLSISNLVFLTSQQALADLATFINTMNTKYQLSPDVKWIVFGGSYPGSLAAWMRQKYPHLVHGAMSASGPLLAKLNFAEYFKVVYDDLRAYSDQCLMAVKQGTAQVEILLRHKIGQRNLSTLFKLCDSIEENISNTLDLSNLFETLSGNFAGVAQYNKDNRIGKSKMNVSLDTLCDIMVNQSIGPQVNRLAAVNNLILNMTNQTCLDYKYDKMIENLKNTSWDSETSEGGRQWTYQTCTEFGFFQTSDYKPQVFGDRFSLNFSIQQCQDIFGPEYDEQFLNDAIDRTNILYGALDIEVTNVVFVHGSVDPWHVLGLTKTKDNNAPALYVKGAAHCANMYPRSDNDSPDLKAARVQIQNFIQTWLDL